jgi:hypothetical protein
VEGYVAWALCTVLTKVVYICLLDYQNTVSCSILGQFVLFNWESEDTLLGECLALFGIVVMAKYGISFSFHSICMI